MRNVIALVLAALQAIFGDASVGRQSGPFGDFAIGTALGATGSSFTGIPNADLAGTLRLVRSGGHVTGSVGGAPFFSADGVTGDTVPGFAMRAAGNIWTRQAVRVAFDDFRLNSGALSCPGWWQDFFPDVSR